MTWHQWHHTASRSRMTKRCSARARANNASLHPSQVNTESSAHTTEVVASTIASAVLMINRMGVLASFCTEYEACRARVSAEPRGGSITLKVELHALYRHLGGCNRDGDGLALVRKGD